MAQAPHFTVTGTATDIGAGLDAGSYVAQVVAPLAMIGDRAVLYATAEEAPADDDDYFRAGHRQVFTFAVGTCELPVWVKTTASTPIPVAVARR